MQSWSHAFLPLYRASKREREGTHREAMGRVRAGQASIAQRGHSLTPTLSPLAGGEGEKSPLVVTEADLLAGGDGL